MSVSIHAKSHDSLPRANRPIIPVLLLWCFLFSTQIVSIISHFNSRTQASNKSIVNIVIAKTQTYQIRNIEKCKVLITDNLIKDKSRIVIGCQISKTLLYHVSLYCGKQSQHDANGIPESSIYQ